MLWGSSATRRRTMRSSRPRATPILACAMRRRSLSELCGDSLVLMRDGSGVDRGERTAAFLVLLAACSVAACTTKEPTTETYFDRTIYPIVQGSCGSTNTAANC